MSVKIIDNKAFYGFRVRRMINGELHQEYFSLKRNGKRLSNKATSEIRKQAEARDAELIEQVGKERLKRKAERCFHPDGSVRGISYLYKRGKSGTNTPIFQVGISSWLDNKIICTSYSINAHGKKNAWIKAVNKFAQHKQIGRKTKLYKQLLGAMDKTIGRRPFESVRFSNRSIEN
ncbi:MAG: hypothetical protein AAF431_16685 [Pseudomonadota bacterium]